MIVEGFDIGCSMIAAMYLVLCESHICSRSWWPTKAVRIGRKIASMLVVGRWWPHSAATDR